MSACEKCWSDAYMRMLTDPSKSQSDHYQHLLEERKDDPCSAHACGHGVPRDQLCSRCVDGQEIAS